MTLDTSPTAVKAQIAVEDVTLSPLQHEGELSALEEILLHARAGTLRVVAVAQPSEHLEEREELLIVDLQQLGTEVLVLHQAIKHQLLRHRFRKPGENGWK